MKFDSKTLLNLGAYVYMLVDPADNRPFYVGKGNSNRVFQHMDCALKSEDAVTAKYEIIRAIRNSKWKKPKHVIVRHGLSDEDAFQIEAALIDSLRFIGIELSNLVNGHNSVEKGIMTAEQIIGLYNAKPLRTLPSDCIIININRKYPEARLKGPDAIYRATKGIWAINKSVLLDEKNQIRRRYVLSEYRGLIVEVFQVNKWYQLQRGYNPKAKKPKNAVRMGWAFEGVIAEDSVRKRFINKSIEHAKGKGVATAHRVNL